MRFNSSWTPPSLGLIPPFALSADAHLAETVARASVRHNEPTTISGYNTAARSWACFCERRNLPPFPVYPYVFSMFMHWRAMTISMNSLLGVYTAGVKDACITQGFPWPCSGDPTVTRTVRFLLKKYGRKGGKEKAPVTVASILAMAKRLPGWPNLADLSHDDRLFLLAASMGTFGFLRGGEFMTSPKASRAVLLGSQLRLHMDSECVSVDIVMPKATWWETSRTVVVYSPEDECPVAPHLLLQAYRAHSVVPLHPACPALKTSSGAVLSKAWMIKRTRSLMDEAGITFYSRSGLKILAGASSFRAGGVESARSANILAPVIQALGRWSSEAWMRYASSARRHDLRAAATRMYSAAVSPTSEQRVDSVVDQVGRRAVPADGHDDLVVGDVSGDLVGADGLSHHEVGATIATQWGEASVVAKYPNGDLLCRWEGYTDAYILSGVRRPDQVRPEVGHGAFLPPSEP